MGHRVGAELTMKRSANSNLARKGKKAAARKSGKRYVKRVPPLSHTEIAFLEALPLNVDLDIAQVSSVTRQSPGTAIAVMNKLMGAHKVEVLEDVLEIGRARYKRVAL